MNEPGRGRRQAVMSAASEPRVVDLAGASAIELYFSDNTGAQERLVLKPKVESARHGEIIVSVRDGKIERVQDSTRAGPF